MHFFEIEAVMLEEALIFGNPNVFQKHLRHLVEIDPVITQWRAAAIEEHGQGARRINEAKHGDL